MGADWFRTIGKILRASMLESGFDESMNTASTVLLRFWWGVPVNGVLHLLMDAQGKLCMVWCRYELVGLFDLEGVGV